MPKPPLKAAAAAAAVASPKTLVVASATSAETSLSAVSPCVAARATSRPSPAHVLSTSSPSPLESSGRLQGTPWDPGGSIAAHTQASFGEASGDADHRGRVERCGRGQGAKACTSAPSVASKQPTGLSREDGRLQESESLHREDITEGWEMPATSAGRFAYGDPYTRVNSRDESYRSGSRDVNDVGVPLHGLATETNVASGVLREDGTVGGDDTRSRTMGSSPGSSPSAAAGFFRLRHVRIDSLLQDGTLGLLLHGTSIVGFCSHQAEDMGWCVGDQIVEVNGERVTLFDEFLDHFMSAQEQGFPIDFGVLRREVAEVTKEVHQDAEVALEKFFGATSLFDLAGQLQEKFGFGEGEASQNAETDRLGEDCDSVEQGNESITENPYIQALRKRRNELYRSAEGWTTEVTESLASRLATERSDALATLLRSPGRATRDDEDEQMRHCGATPLPRIAPGWLSCMPHTKCDATYPPQVDPKSSPRVTAEALEASSLFPSVHRGRRLSKHEEECRPEPVKRGRGCPSGPASAAEKYPAASAVDAIVTGGGGNWSARGSAGWNARGAAGWSPRVNSTAGWSGRPYAGYGPTASALAAEEAAAAVVSIGETRAELLSAARSSDSLFTGSANGGPLDVRWDDSGLVVENEASTEDSRNFAQNLLLSR
eukprot:TRINITY_DN16796_c0_g2_i1.p1 TRINITY_DN16796_c0_g2~~TRINITY_DN16796_c0_g2_i1.p1  ORF type:complete len:659 (+),score=118.14 TRINITY_DN16796_c0_g2_i1:50-2026(+)